MTREEIKNTPELVDFMLDKSVIADSRMKLHKRLEELCKLALNALEQESCKKDCISRQIISEYVESHIQEINTGYGDLNSHTNRILRMIVDYIEKMPKAEQESKTGRWIKEETIHGWDGCSYQCSECGRSIHLDTVVEDLTDYPYCHCGARMKRGE